MRSSTQGQEGQILLSHSKVGLLFHPHHRACLPCPCYHFIKELPGCLPITALVQATLNGGNLVPVGGRTLSRYRWCGEPP